MRYYASVIIGFARIASGVRRRMRRYYYSQVLKSMGPGCEICDNVVIAGPQSISFGKQVFLNEGVVLQSCEGAQISIGSLVVLSFGAKVLTGGLNLSDGRVDFFQHDARAVKIEDAVWVGAGAIVLPGVTIGGRSVIAAGSVVNRSVEPATLVAGVPARVIRALRQDR